MATVHCSSTNPKKARLLCVDDDPQFLMLFATVLEATAYTVVATTIPTRLLN
ncbi:MAG TPA: hypothetical protein VI685_29615 [Candidatus Angelobacter sp.]